MAHDNLPEYTVSELSSALRRTLEDAYGFVRVRGELSGVKLAGSGHLYFCLKDDQAGLDGVCWRNSRSRFTFAPEDGLEVVCTGRITTYAARSKYQLIVETMAPAGVGALMALLEERRRKLAAEGLFALERKRPLPFLPEVVGVVTSPSGAVIRDILHRLADRFPRHVLLWPVLVQGEQAAEQVTRAIEGFNRLGPDDAVPRPDVLIVARGGGSIEDLWAFNEEIVVRAAAASAIPLVSAVGHETDTTLIDLAADRRAPTPTAAAEMIVPVRSELVRAIEDQGGRLRDAALRLLRQHEQHLVGLARGLPDPRLLLGHASQRLDDLAERLPQGLRGLAERKRAALAALVAQLGTPGGHLREAEGRMLRQDQRLRDLFGGRLREAEAELRRLAARLHLDELGRRLPRRRDEIDEIERRLAAAVERRLAAARERVQVVAQLLEGLSYEGVLRRGYALVRDAHGQAVTTAEEARAARALELQFADGRVPARVGETGARRPRPLPAQGRLL